MIQVQTVTTKYGKIEYSRYGQGTPVLFLHGGHSNAQETLTHKYMDLHRFQIITPSRPGYGQTTLQGNESPEHAARLILELMNELHIDKFHVIGISAGGLTAIALVSQHPDRVIKFVMASSISKRWLYPKDDLYKKARKIFHPKVERYTWAMLRGFLAVFPKMLIKMMASELTKVKISKLSKEAISDMKNMLLHQRSYHGFINDLEHDLDESVISKIQIKTLILHSENDQSIEKSHPEFAHRKIQNSTLIWVDNQWGHLIWVGDESRDVVGFIVEFLEDSGL